jgi:hypothetical protein
MLLNKYLSSCPYCPCHRWSRPCHQISLFQTVVFVEDKIHTSKYTHFGAYYLMKRMVDKSVDNLIFTVKWAIDSLSLTKNLNVIFERMTSCRRHRKPTKVWLIKIMLNAAVFLWPLVRLPQNRFWLLFYCTFVLLDLKWLDIEVGVWDRWKIYIGLGL